MAKAGLIVCVVIVAMDVAAGILSIEAEKAQNRVKHKRLRIFECKDASRDALKLGLAAVVLLTLANVTMSLLAGCTCIYSTEEHESSSATRRASFACLIFSWFTAAVGFPMLIIGTLANSKSRESCGILHHHLLSIGGILCFIHGLCCIAYYISVTVYIGKESS
ncbi:hypothetical protein CsSME_00026288 [Camellia sinensis var. sinensis]